MKKGLWRGKTENKNVQLDCQAILSHLAFMIINLKSDYLAQVCAFLQQSSSA